MPSKTKTNVNEDQERPQDPEAPVDVVTLPDDLLAALQGYEGIAGVDSWFTRDKTKVDMRRIELVQPNARNHPTMYNGKPTAGRIALVRGKAGQLEVEYVDAMRLILIDPLTFDQYKMPPHLQSDPRVLDVVRRDKGIGERMMWQHNNAGGREVVEGEKPLCTSNNGLFPWAQNIGKDIPDPRWATQNGQQVMHRIGFVYEPEFGFAPIENPCLSCPFAQWVNEKESNDGKRKKPMCQPTHRYVVWDIDRSEMFTIKGSNGTVHNALAGAGAGTFGSKYDGSPLPGIVYHFTVAGMLNKVTSERLDITAFIKRKNAIPGDQIAEWAKDWTPFYRNRPDGVPSLDRPYAPVYPVMLTVTQSMKNNYGSQPVVPNFTLLDGSTRAIDGVFHTPENTNWIATDAHPLSPEETAAWLRALGEYQADGWRDILMGFSVRADDVAPLLNAPMPSPQQALPANAPVQLQQQPIAGPADDVDINNPFG